jgi:hypothetical protein
MREILERHQFGMRVGITALVAAIGKSTKTLTAMRKGRWQAPISPGQKAL